MMRERGAGGLVKDTADSRDTARPMRAVKAILPALLDVAGRDGLSCSGAQGLHVLIIHA